MDLIASMKLYDSVFLTTKSTKKHEKISWGRKSHANSQRRFHEIFSCFFVFFVVKKSLFFEDVKLG